MEMDTLSKIIWAVLGLLILLTVDVLLGDPVGIFPGQVGSTGLAWILFLVAVAGMGFVYWYLS